MVAGHGVKDMVAAKEGPTKKHVLATAATWAGVTALAAYQTFGPTKSMKKEGFYAALTVGTANTGLCLLAAKDM